MAISIAVAIVTKPPETPRTRSSEGCDEDAGTRELGEGPNQSVGLGEGELAGAVGARVSRGCAAGVEVV
ncbi:MAG: hypothetical protein ABSH51_15165 [Solirubrobacteraceae bacterium]